VGALALRLHAQRGLVLAGLRPAAATATSSGAAVLRAGALRAAIARAAQRWSVSGALLAAQLYEESHFNPFARSAAGRSASRSSCPPPRRVRASPIPFDAERAIDAQAHLMRDLLRAFASVPLALAAYNAGPNRVRACGCRPRHPRDPVLRRRHPRLLHGAATIRRPRGRPEVRLVR
jgi:soluble lytic murein transglycosylase-like protein